jgi:hypothetical protein
MNRYEWPTYSKHKHDFPILIGDRVRLNASGLDIVRNNEEKEDGAHSLEWYQGRCGFIDKLDDYGKNWRYIKWDGDNSNIPNSWKLENLEHAYE